jgi:hypothetical protein
MSQLSYLLDDALRRGVPEACVSRPRIARRDEEHISFRCI